MTPFPLTLISSARPFKYSGHPPGSGKKEIFHKKTRFALATAALSAITVITAVAAVMLLSPKDVAQQAGNEALAAAFESKEATAVNQTKAVGDYQVTLMWTAAT